MDFISNKQPQNKEMLEIIGAKDIEALFAAIPESLRLSKIEIDDGLSEYEGKLLMEDLAHKNTFSTMENYLGAGAYEHHVPALVNAVCSKSEFLTSYTPYQAEASQGMLQIIFEFQSAICALTGLDVANASLYDGASACAEALLMGIRHKQCTKVALAANLHPHYRAVIEQYLSSHHINIIEIPFQDDGTLNTQVIDQYIDNQTAAFLIQYPNFFGSIDNMKSISQHVHKKGALFIVSANPLVYGLYASAAEINADIAIGDCQPLGLPLQFGGPYAGYIACRKELVRQLPGRIVGETVDTKGRKGYVLTLQAREQHIRREKATSNICTNQALAALASLVAILWYGKKGLHKLALTNYQRTAYLKNALESIPKIISLTGNSPSKIQFLNEFAIKWPYPAEKVYQHFRSHNIEPGLHLGEYFRNLKDYFLIAVTETKSKAQLDRFITLSQNF